MLPPPFPGPWLQDVLKVAKEWELSDFGSVFTLDSAPVERLASLLEGMRPRDIATVCEGWNPDEEILQESASTPCRECWRCPSGHPYREEFV